MRPFIGLAIVVLWCVCVETAWAGLGDGLLGYWPMDEGGGTTVGDTSGHGNDGVLQGGAVWTTGQVGNAVSFDGVDGVVEVADTGEDSILDQYAVTDAFTVCYWIKDDDSSEWPGCFAKCGYPASYDTDPYLNVKPWGIGNAGFGCDTRAGQHSCNTGSYDGGWHHWMATYQGNSPEPPTVRFYRDGVEQAVTWTRYVDGDTIGANDYPVSFGAAMTYLGNYTWFFSGEMDEVAFWDRVLSADEIGEVYSSGQNGLNLSIAITQAHDPSPTHEAPEVSPQVVMSWTTGEDPSNPGGPNPAITAHFVYMSTAGDPTLTLVATIPVGGGAAYDPPGDLDMDATYYWRIDERLSSDTDVITGEVWSFDTVVSLPVLDPALPADVFIDVGGDAVFTVSATNPFTGDETGLSYQWYKGPETVLNDGGGYTGTNTDTLTVVGAEIADAGQYFCRVTTNASGQYADSRMASLIANGLLGWWPLDGHANDAVGTHHGTLVGDAGWVAGGHDGGGAIELDGDGDFVEIIDPEDYFDTVILSGNAITLSIWAQSSSSARWGGLLGKGDKNVGGWYLQRWGYADDGFDFEVGGGYLYSGAFDDFNDGGWHHYVGTYDGSVRRMYIDGQEVASDRPNAAIIPLATSLVIGCRQYAAGAFDSFYEGQLDDARVYNCALSEGQVLHLYNPELAWDCSPANGAHDVPRDVVLSWSAGESASEHDVYFGVSYEDVEAASRTYDPNGVLVSQGQAGTTYIPSYTLEAGQTYYWRVDERDGEDIWKGKVWRFTVPYYMTVDDMEGYNNSDNRIYETWADGYHNGGSGSTLGWPDDGPYVETENVKPWPWPEQGSQSMPYRYDNGGVEGKPYYSEIVREYASPQDWGSHDNRELVLWFFGDPVNDPEPMYVTLGDGDGAVTVAYDGDVNDLTVARWHEWDVKLSEFAEVGVDLSQIRSVCIGFGDRGNPQPGGSGIVCFDDIRLYPARCRLEYEGPKGDINFDCMVDLRDLDILANNWLSASPATSAVDVYADDNVNLKDFSVQGINWLTEQRWANYFTNEGAVCAIHGFIEPQAWYRDGKTFIVYQGWLNAPEITYYDHANGQWSDIVMAGVNPLGGTDTHGAPAILIDQGGYIHLFYGSHGGAQKYERSVAPLDISQWQSMPDLPDGTYPMPVQLDDGTILLYYRTGANNPWVQISSSDGGASWSGQSTIINFSPDGLYASFRRGSDGQTVHCTWTHKQFRLGIEWYNRRHCFYMKRDVDGQWKSASGEVLAVPVTISEAYAKCLVARTDAPRHSNVGVVYPDSNNQPMITFLDGNYLEDHFVHKFAYWTGAEWQVSDITDTDEVFDEFTRVDAAVPGRLDVFLTAGGSDTTFYKRGGDLQQWRSTDNGLSWFKVKDIATFAETGRLYANPYPVVNGVRDAYVVFCTWINEPNLGILGYRADDFTHQVFLYGDNGFVKKRWR